MGSQLVDSFGGQSVEIRQLVATISKSLDLYEHSTGSLERSDALASIHTASTRLKNVTTTAQDAFSDFTLGPLANACVRIAVSIGVFDHLTTETSNGVTAKQLSELTETDLPLIHRVLRGLVAFDVISLDDATGLYSHTPMSLVYTEPSRCAWAIWMWDVMIQAATTGLGQYFENGSKPYAISSDKYHTPFAAAHGTENKEFFEITRAIGKLPLFNNAMSGSSVVCAKEAVAAFDFSSLRPGNDGVVLVDVGGAEGQTIQEIKRANPQMNGTVVLQDLEKVLQAGTTPDVEAQVMAYDFFKQVQPVKGAGAYLYQRIFHDWNDEDSKVILDNLRPAMAPHSRLLICDVVVQAHRPHSRKVMRDINMLLIGGLERTEQQWTDLLQDRGFSIVQIHRLHNPDNSIIEARLT